MKTIKKFIKTILLVVFVTLSCSDSPTDSNPEPSPEWHVQNSGTTRNLQDVQFLNEDFGYVVGGFGTILKTTDGGLNWIGLSSPTNKSLRKMSFLDENTGFVAGNAGTLFKTTDGGSTWIDLSGNINSAFAVQDITFIDQNTGYVIIGDRIYKTENSGLSWTDIYTYSGDVWYFRFNRIEFVNENSGYALGGHTDDSGSGGDLIKTEDGGESWTIVNVDTLSELFTMSFPDENTGYLFSMYIFSSPIVKMYKTVDGGVNWSELTNADFGEIVFDSDFTDSNNGYVVGSNGNIFVTPDGGFSWNKQETTTTSTLTTVYFLNSSTGFAAGNDGVILKYY